MSEYPVPFDGVVYCPEVTGNNGEIIYIDINKQTQIKGDCCIFVKKGDKLSVVGWANSSCLATLYPYK